MGNLFGSTFLSSGSRAAITGAGKSLMQTQLNASAGSSAAKEEKKLGLAARTLGWFKGSSMIMKVGVAAVAAFLIYFLFFRKKGRGSRASILAKARAAKRRKRAGKI